MKVSKFFAALFALLGMVITVGSILFCFANRDASPNLGDTTREANACAENFMAALAAGDADTARSLLYGGAELDIRGRDNADPIWQAYYDHFQYAFSGDSYMTGTDFYRDVSVTTLDVPSVTLGLSLRAKTLLTAQLEQAEDPSALYGEDDQFLPEVVDPIMEQAFSDAIREDAAVQTRSCKLQLCKSDGRWQVIPDANLLLALAGGVN